MTVRERKLNPSFHTAARVLEDKLQAKLSLTRVTDNRRELSASSVKGRLDTGVVNSPGWRREVRMVEDIEQFSTELQADVFVDARILQDAEVSLYEAWAPRSSFPGCRRCLVDAGKQRRCTSWFTLWPA